MKVEYKSLCEQAAAAGYYCTPSYGYDQIATQLKPLSAEYMFVPPGTETEIGDEKLSMDKRKWVLVESGVTLNYVGPYVRRRVKAWHEL